jgi:hypothetical protein
MLTIRGTHYVEISEGDSHVFINWYDFDAIMAQLESIKIEPERPKGEPPISLGGRTDGHR